MSVRLIFHCAMEHSGLPCRDVFKKDMRFYFRIQVLQYLKDKILSLLRSKTWGYNTMQRLSNHMPWKTLPLYLRYRTVQQYFPTPKTYYTYSQCSEITQPLTDMVFCQGMAIMRHNLQATAAHSHSHTYIRSASLPREFLGKAMNKNNRQTESSG